MKILLTGEGPTDCGKGTYTKEAQSNWEDGPVQVYIRKVYPDAEIVTVDKYTLRDLSAQRKTRHTRAAMRLLQGHGEKAFFVAQIASEQRFDVAAMYVDSDKSAGAAPKDEGACRKRYKLIRDQVLEGLAQGGAEKPLAIVPMKMIECWILGDPDAFLKVFGISPTASLLKNPELIWGDVRDPNSDYPKHRLERVLKECHAERSQDIYVLIAQASEIKALCKNCPISFADFIEQLEAL